MADKQDNGIKVEKLPLDLNLSEYSAQGGYMSAFLIEHTKIMDIICAPEASLDSKMITATMAIRLKVSLITDLEKREELWKWYDDEVTNRTKAYVEKNHKEPTAQDKATIIYDTAIILLGKVMDFMGKHLSKPLEVGTE